MVDSYVQLWEHDAHVMMRSLFLHSGIMRENMLRHEGYEVFINPLLFDPKITNYYRLKAAVNMDRNPSTGRFEYFTNELGIVGALARNAGKGWVNMTADMYTKIMAQPDRLSRFYMEDASPLFWFKILFCLPGTIFYYYNVIKGD